MPPLIIALVNNKEAVDKYDTSSVNVVFTGAAPLGAETTSEVIEAAADVEGAAGIR